MGNAHDASVWRKSTSRVRSESGATVSHSQTTQHSQPFARRSLRFRSSLALFSESFLLQYCTRVDGGRPLLQSWPCQKQPWTKTTLRLGAKTRSGRPGRSGRCSEYRYPSRCRRRLTIISGAVSFCPTERMMRERTEGVTLSTIGRHRIRPRGGRQPGGRRTTVSREWMMVG